MTRPNYQMIAQGALAIAALRPNSADTVGLMSRPGASADPTISDAIAAVAQWGRDLHYPRRQPFPPLLPSIPADL
jgi:hypothetical protein